jgi:hypothetical protein
VKVWLASPCWVLVAPDGEIGAWCREGEWDGSHYATEADADSDIVDAIRDAVENLDEKDATRARSLHAAQLRNACHTIVCDGCGADYEEDEIHIHFGPGDTTALQLRWTQSGDVHRCPDCPPPPDPDEAHLPGPGDVPLFDMQPSGPDRQ